MKSTVRKMAWLLMPVALLCLSCHHGSEAYEPLYARILSIKAQGDSVPETALQALDSLRESVMSSGVMHLERVYELTEIRLRDKAYLGFDSDDLIVMLCRYFEKFGTPAEKMESQYYLGRVSFELKNYPQAMESFLKAIAIGESGAKVELQVLQCAYSQMAEMYTVQLNREGAKEMARKGLELSIRTGTVDPIYLMDVGTASYHAGDTAEAMTYFKRTLEMIKRDGSGKKFPAVTAELLTRFSESRMRDEADYCLQCMNELPAQKRPHNYLYAMGSYCARFVSADSAAHIFRQMYESSPSWAKKANAAYALMWHYRLKGDYKTSSDYAVALHAARDSMTRERELEQTAISSGEQLFRRSQREEQEAEAKAARYRNNMLYGLTAALLVILVLSLLYAARMRRAYRKLRERDKAIHDAHETLESLGMKLAERQDAMARMERKMNEREREQKELNQKMSLTKAELEQKQKELGRTQRELGQTQKELGRNQKELKRTQRKVRNLIGCNVVATADEESNDLVGRIKSKAAKKEMMELTESEWNILAAYIEYVHPGFHQDIKAKFKDLSIQKMRAAFLWKVGLPQARIAQWMNFSPQTAMRWVKDFEELLGDE